jgi:hypothetical protein
MAVLGLTVVVGLGMGLLIAQPWDGPTVVDALELDDEAALRDDDAPDGEVRDDDGDDDRNGPGSRDGSTRERAADATDDRRDGTRDGDTSHGRGTGTGNSRDGGAGTDAATGGGSVSRDAGSLSGGGSVSGGGDT